MYFMRQFAKLRERERERDRERQTDRETERDRQTDRQRQTASPPARLHGDCFFSRLAACIRRREGNTKVREAVLR